MEWQLDLAKLPDATKAEAWDSVKQAIAGTKTSRGPAAARAVNDDGSHIHLTWKAIVSYGSVYSWCKTHVPGEQWRLRPFAGVGGGSAAALAVASASAVAAVASAWAVAAAPDVVDAAPAEKNEEVAASRAFKIASALPHGRAADTLSCP